MAPDNKQGQ